MASQDDDGTKEEPNCAFWPAWITSCLPACSAPSPLAWSRVLQNSIRSMQQRGWSDAVTLVMHLSASVPELSNKWPAGLSETAMVNVRFEPNGRDGENEWFYLNQTSMLHDGLAVCRAQSGWLERIAINWHCQMPIDWTNQFASHHLSVDRWRLFNEIPANNRAL